MKTEKTNPFINLGSMPYWITEIREACIGRPIEFKAMYVNLMEEMWRKSGHLDDDKEYLMRVSGASKAQWEKHSRALLSLFVISDGKVIHAKFAKDTKKNTA